MEHPKTETEIAAYEDTKSLFVDFRRFEGDAHHRALERNAFINNLEYTPNYDYPQLDSLIDDDKITSKKSKIYEAVMELEAAKKQPDANVAELELFASFHELRLKKIMLVEAARNLSNPISMSDQDVNRRSFAELNEAVYGKFDESCYLGMLATEKAKLTSMVPRNEITAGIKSELESYLGHIETGVEHESPLLNELDMRKLHSFVIERYGDVLGVVPDTDDNVFYDVTQCVEIINEALETGGLARLGWKAIENPSKSNPSTKQEDSTINLPSDTMRTAAQLRRLIIHEQEVHARRAQNGLDSGLAPLKSGTANYVDIEEGLSVILECAVDGNFDNQSFDRARDRYITAGLALGADGQPRDARETFEILWRIMAVDNSDPSSTLSTISEDDVINAKERAYAHVENAYRGTQFWMKGIIYTKLKVYYEGLAKNAEFIKQNINSLDEAFGDAFIGKYNHTDPVEKELVQSAIAARRVIK